MALAAIRNSECFQLKNDCLSLKWRPEDLPSRPPYPWSSLVLPPLVHYRFEDLLRPLHLSVYMDLPLMP